MIPIDVNGSTRLTEMANIHISRLLQTRGNTRLPYQAYLTSFARLLQALCSLAVVCVRPSCRTDSRLRPHLQWHASDSGGDDERPPEEKGIEATPYCRNLMMSWRLCRGRLTSCITAGQADERVADRHELQTRACTNLTPHVRFDWASIRSIISSVDEEMVCWLAGCRLQHPHWNIAMTRAEGCSSVCGESGVGWGSAILNPTNTSKVDEVCI
jgi:hypothetical protein